MQNFVYRRLYDFAYASLRMTMDIINWQKCLSLHSTQHTPIIESGNFQLLPFIFKKASVIYAYKSLHLCRSLRTNIGINVGKNRHEFLYLIIYIANKAIPSEEISLRQKAVLYSNLCTLDKKAPINSKKIWWLFACMKKGCTFAFEKCRKKTFVFLRHFAFIYQRVNYKNWHFPGQLKFPFDTSLCQVYCIALQKC